MSITEMNVMIILLQILLYMLSSNDKPVLR